MTRQKSYSLTTRRSPFLASVRMLLVLAISIPVGCSYSGSEPGSSYGEPNEWKGRNSVAGSSILKTILTQQGYRVFRFPVLSDRSKKLDAIIWIPTDIQTPSQAAITWFENWLAASPNRVVVYLGRDCNPVGDYWRLAAAGASPSRAADFLNEAALSSSQNDTMRAQLGDLAFCRWFIVDNRDPSVTVQTWKGDWAEQFELKASPFKVYGRLVPVSDFSDSELNKAFSKPVVTKPAAPMLPQVQGNSNPSAKPKSSDDPTTPKTETSPTPTGESSDSNSSDSDSQNPQSSTQPIPTSAPQNPSTKPTPANAPPFSWMQEKPETLDWNVEKNLYKAYSTATLLTTDDDSPFLFEVTKPEWGSSRILVVGNAGPFLNLGMTDPDNRRLASVLSNQLTGASRVGMLIASNHARIDDGSPDDKARAFGLLTTWPLNLITLHAAFFGLLILVALFPSFGRPRSIPSPSTQDFGDHIQALGDLMYATGDRGYALHAVANYFRTVKGESSNPWAHVDSQVDPQTIASATVAPTPVPIISLHTTNDVPKSGDES